MEKIGVKCGQGPARDVGQLQNPRVRYREVPAQDVRCSSSGALLVCSYEQ
jgi:hypothetical protein